ncbi:MAG: DUF5317 family protein [Clostridia bacterium]
MILLYLIPIALAIGYARGGRLHRYIERPLRGIGLPCVAFLLEAALNQVPKWTGFAPEMSLMLCVVAEYALLTLFCGLNMDRFGMKGVAAGVALNMLVIFANGFRMPVGAIARSIPALAETVARIDSGELVEYVMADAGATLEILGDVIRIKWLPKGLASVGDFVLGAGVAAVLVGVMGARAHEKKRPDEAEAGQEPPAKSR